MGPAVQGLVQRTEIPPGYLNAAPSVDYRSAECEAPVVVTGDGSWRSQEVTLGHTDIPVSPRSDQSTGTRRLVFHREIL